ncbi:MAG: drug/metabolite transporter (DMT)-like permease, partial [Gammaproteobacteria bacterium]
MKSASVPELPPRLWSGLLLVICGAVLLSAKGILSKLLYIEGLDFQEVITIRSVLSLPLFWLWGIYIVGLPNIIKVDKEGLLGALAAGFFCYFIGGSLDFYALTMIDAGLERVLLYTYPAIIVLTLAVWRRRLPPLSVIGALFMTYVGILFAIGIFDLALWRANSFGALLVLICAVSYAGYFFANDLVGKKIGSIVFTIYAMSAATVALIVHFSLTHSVLDLALSPRAWCLFLIMVVFVTVVPLFMMAEGVKQIGAQRAGLLSTVGPASTIILAAIFLGEDMRWFQYGGVAIT